MSKKGVITITVEELEIIVSAKIEQVKPQIQKVVKEIKEAVKNTDGIGSEMLGKIDTAKIAKEMGKVKKQVKGMFDISDTKGMKINGKNLINGINQSFKTLKGQKVDLGNVIEFRNYQNKLAQIATVAHKTKEAISSVGTVKYNTSAIQNFIDSYGQKNDSKKVKLDVESPKKVKDELKQSTNSGNKLSKTIQQIKNNLTGAGNSAKKMSVGLNTAKNVANKVSANLKVGLGQIMKIVGSLIGLRAIYSGLQSVANSWLSSQDKQAKQLSANIEYMKFALGSALRPAIEIIVNLVYQALKGVQSLIYALTGVNIFANASAKAYTSMANSAKNAQKATLALADIDEIHNIHENNNSGPGTPNINLSDIDNNMANWFDKLKNGDFYGLGVMLGKKINESLEKIPWTKIKEKAGNCGKKIGEFINGGVNTINWELVGGTLAEGVNTAMRFLENFLKTTDFKSCGEAVARTINGFFDKIEWETVGQIISDGLIAAIDLALGFVDTFDTKKVADAIVTVLENIDWSTVTRKLIEIMTRIGLELTGIPTLVRIVKGIVKGIGQAIELLKGKIKENGGNIVNGIFEGILDALVDIAKWVVENVFEPMINAFKSAFGIHSPATKMKPVGMNIIEGIKEGISNAKEGILDFIAETCEKIIRKFNIGLNGGEVHSSTLIHKTQSSIYSNVEKAKENFAKSGATVTESVNSGMLNNDVTGTVRNVVSNIKSAFSRGLDSNSSFTWGYDMIQGFINGVNSVKNTLTNTVKKVAGSIRSFLHFSRPDEGPLRDYETWMPDMVEGLSRTLTDALPILDNAVEGVSDTIANNLKNASLDYSVDTNINKNINTNLSSDLENAVYSAIQKAENLFRLTINNELKLNTKTVAREILDDINNEAKRRGYKPILQRG